MQSTIFKLTSSDWVKGLVVFVLAAVFTWLAQLFDAPGFDFATFQWDELLRIAGGAFVTYMAKNLLTSDNGKFLGAIG